MRLRLVSDGIFFFLLLFFLVVWTELGWIRCGMDGWLGMADRMG
jgi:hypothetical protein